MNLNESFERARVKSVDFTKATGNEYGVILTDTGQWVYETSGTPDGLDFGDDTSLLEGNWLFHSHPNNSSFSIDDIRATWTSKAKGIYAVGLEGSIFVASELKFDASLQRMGAELAHYQAFKMANEQYQRKKFSKQESNFIASHWMMRYLHEAGLVKYDYKLGDVNGPAWDRFVRTGHKALELID